MKNVIAMLLCLMSMCVYAKDSKWYKSDASDLYEAGKKTEEVMNVLDAKMKALLADKALNASDAMAKVKHLMWLNEQLMTLSVKSKSFETAMMLAGYAEKTDLPSVQYQLMWLCKNELMLQRESFYVSDFVKKKMDSENPSLVTENLLFVKQFNAHTALASAKCKKFEY